MIREAAHKPDELPDNFCLIYIKWVKDIIKRHLDVMFENCASGGCRMDADLLKSFELQSTSDQTDYRKYAPISANIYTAITPEQSGVWVCPLEDSDEEATAFSIVNAILKRVYQSGRLDKLSKECYALVEEAYKVYESLKDVIKNGYPIFPLGLACFDDKYVSSGLKYNDDIYLCVWNLDNMGEIRIPVYSYNISDIEIVYPRCLKINYKFEGKELVIKPHQEYFARLFKLKR